MIIKDNVTPNEVFINESRCSKYVDSDLLKAIEKTSGYIGYVCAVGTVATSDVKTINVNYTVGGSNKSLNPPLTHKVNIKKVENGIYAEMVVLDSQLRTIDSGSSVEEGTLLNYLVVIKNNSNITNITVSLNNQCIKDDGNTGLFAQTTYYSKGYIGYYCPPGGLATSSKKIAEINYTIGGEYKTERVTHEVKVVNSIEYKVIMVREDSITFNQVFIDYGSAQPIKIGVVIKRNGITPNTVKMDGKSCEPVYADEGIFDIQRVSGAYVYVNNLYPIKDYYRYYCGERKLNSVSIDYAEAGNIVFNSDDETGKIVINYESLSGNKTKELSYKIKKYWTGMIDYGGAGASNTFVTVNYNDRLKEKIRYINESELKYEGRSDISSLLALYDTMVFNTGTLNSNKLYISGVSECRSGNITSCYFKDMPVYSPINYYATSTPYFDFKTLGSAAETSINGKFGNMMGYEYKLNIGLKSSTSREFLQTIEEKIKDGTAVVVSMDGKHAVSAIGASYVSDPSKLKLSDILVFDNQCNPKSGSDSTAEYPCVRTLDEIAETNTIAYIAFPK